MSAYHRGKGARTEEGIDGSAWIRPGGSFAALEFIPSRLGTTNSPLRMSFSNRTPGYIRLKEALDTSRFQQMIIRSADGIQIDLPYREDEPVSDSVRRAVDAAMDVRHAACRGSRSSGGERVLNEASAGTSIDITFDVESDAGGRDPDKYSPTLRRYHQILWSKRLPDGTPFRLDTQGQGTYLRYKGLDRILSLASDAIVHSYRASYTNRIGDVIAQVDPDLVSRVFKEGSTIGGFILFPGTVRDRKPTINGARGMNWRIADRFDLTLECIRRHYDGGSSPLTDVLDRYGDFFELFGDFGVYVDFFLLQDLLGPYGGVVFHLPFDDFQRSPLPETVAEYESYAHGVLQFVAARNARIAEWAENHLSGQG
jgi:hypothetical protein